MRRHQRNAAANATVSMLKTCQTCIRAKIRCESSQTSGSCDRCLRLNKPCVFSPAKRRTAAPSKNRMGSKDPISGESESTSATGDLPVGPAVSVDSHDPITCGLIDSESTERLVNLFRSTMTPRFPFVVLPNTTTLQDLRRARPCLLLAVVAVAAYEDFRVQRQLSSLFNQALATKLATGKITSLDVLQGLLVHLAWAQYQPRPRSYTQQLHLATSIVADLRLDRQRRQQLWKVDHNTGNHDEHSTEWGSDELRALIGTYYLASSSSILLQKMRHFPYTPFILESCEKLKLESEYPNDKYLQPILQIQRISEEVDDIVAQKANFSKNETRAKLALVRHQLDTFKSDLMFPLSECPTLLLQLGMIDLVISQQSLPWSSLATRVSQELQYTVPEIVVESFSDTVLAFKSLMDTLITMTPGQEHVLTNLDWITLAYALSCSVRLDVLAADHRISHLTKHLRRSLDIRHTLRQVLLRLRSVVSSEEDQNGDRDTFYQYLRRGEAVEAWHLRQTAGSSISAPSDVNALPGRDYSTPEVGTSTLGVEPTESESESFRGPSESGPFDLSDASIMDLFMDEMQGAGHWPLPAFLNDF